MDKLTVNQVKESLAPSFDKVQGFEETSADFGLTTHKEFISTLVAFSQNCEMNGEMKSKISIIGEKDKNCIHVFSTRYCLPLHKVFRAYVSKNFRIDLNTKKLSEMLKNFPKYEFDFQIECDYRTLLLLKHNGIQYASFSLLEAIEKDVVYFDNVEFDDVELSFFHQNYEQTIDRLFSVSKLEDLIKVAKNLGRKYIRIVSGPSSEFENEYVANIVSTDTKNFEETPVIALFRSNITF
jgi:hypothetical protein